MPKFSKEELSSRINDLDIADDIKISLMEDISDSIDVSNIEKERDDYKAKYEDAVAKYKDRFMMGNSKEDNKDIKEDFKELEEKNVIDIREI